MGDVIMGTMLSNVIAVGSAGFISSKIFKCLGKTDYAETVMLCGWVGMGIAFFTWLNDFSFSVGNSWFGDFFKWAVNLVG
jgi:hypothetical protein